MRLITTDFSKSDCNSIEEQIVVSMMLAIESPDDIVCWKHKGVSFTITYRSTMFRFSMSDTNEVLSRKIKTTLKMFYGNPIHIFRQNSSIDSIPILYMEWDSSVCNKFLEQFG